VSNFVIQADGHVCEVWSKSLAALWKKWSVNEEKTKKEKKKL